MENKKSFILYIDSLDILDELTKEQVWNLFMKIKNYHNWTEYETNDKMVDLVFFNFKNQFDRDSEKYKNICVKNKENAIKWANARWNKTTKMPNGNEWQPKCLDTDSDKDNDNDTISNFLRKITSSKIKEKVEYELKMYKTKFPNKKITEYILNNILEKYNE